MVDRYKTVIKERNGVELDYPEELDFNADEMFFDNSGTPFSADNVGDAFRQISEIDISTLTQFEAFSSEVLESTTSNGWIVKSGYPYTTGIKPPAEYKVDYTIQVTNSQKQKEIGSQFQYSTDGFTWITLAESLSSNATENEYEPRTYFSLITLATESTIQFRWRYGQTDDGGTGRVKEANMSIGKVKD